MIIVDNSLASLPTDPNRTGPALIQAGSGKTSAFTSFHTPLDRCWGSERIVMDWVRPHGTTETQIGRWLIAVSLFVWVREALRKSRAEIAPPKHPADLWLRSVRALRTSLKQNSPQFETSSLASTWTHAGVRKRGDAHIRCIDLITVICISSGSRADEQLDSYWIHRKYL